MTNALMFAFIGRHFAMAAKKYYSCLWNAKTHVNDQQRHCQSQIVLLDCCRHI